MTLEFDFGDLKPQIVSLSLFASRAFSFLSFFCENKETIKTSGFARGSCKPHVSVIRYHNYKASSSSKPKSCNSWGVGSFRHTADFFFNLSLKSTGYPL